MKVSIINHTQDALTLLVFTKNTRLNLSPGLMDDIRGWPESKKTDELEKMAATIKSSWEFLDVVFLIEDVTRACAQQITRTRNATYAMQSQRVTNVSEMEVVNPFNASDFRHQIFAQSARLSKEHYNALVAANSPLEDARGLLPLNTTCNLVAKYNLRALTDLVKSRKSLRAQGEYNSVALAMEVETLRTWPWSAPFFRSEHETAVTIIERIAKELGITTGTGPGWELAKCADLLRKEP